MSEPRYISPMLDGFSLGQAISDHSGVECYPAMRDDSEKRYIVKKISLPASQVQVEALLLTGVYKDEEAVGAYYRELAQLVQQEVRILDQLAGQRGFVPFQSCQIEPMESGVGYEVHLLSRYRKSLERYTRRNPMTHLGALNLGIDLCAALAVSREAGWLFVDLKPENIYLFNDQEYRIGDLGFVALDSLEYASLPDRYRSLYTAPEVADAYSSLNATMDTYALGLVLYQIYNEGKLPFADLDERKMWLEKLAAGEPIAAPACADEEMAQIICKAIAPEPADRWQTPAEMGHALISYMQRNGADDIPIVPPAPVEEEQAEEPAEEPVTVEAEPEAAEITDESAEPAEIPEESAETEETDAPAVKEDAAEADEAPAEAEEVSDQAKSADEPTGEPAEEPEEEPAEEPVADPPEEESGEPTADWIDLMDAFLAEEEEPGSPAPEEGEPTLRELLSDTEELSAEAEAVTEEELSADAADILTVANELIEHEAPAPVVAPEPVELPMPEPIAVEQPAEEAAPEEDSEAAAESVDSPEPDAPAVPAEPAKHKGLVKKLVKTVAALAAAAAIAFAAWFFYENYYLQTIDGIDYQGSAREIVVTVRTAMDESKLTVVCKDTYGNAVNGTLENGTVTFSDLVPGTQYIVSLEPNGFHRLLGPTYITYSTPAETKIIHLTAVTGQEPGSAIISFGVEGQDSDEWTLTCQTEGQEPLVVPFTGHTVTVNELTVGTEYTFTLTTAADVLLVGENTITHTASELVQAQDLALSEYKDGTMTFTWKTPDGVTVDRWIVRCYDNAGYDQLQEVAGNTAAFTGITEGGKYVVEVTASNMTLGTRAEVTATASSVSDFTAVLSGSSIELTWTSTDATPYQIECSVDGSVLQVIIPEENKASFAPAVPGTTYTFTIKPSNISAEVSGITATVEVPAPGTFSANKLDSETIIVEMFDVPSKSGWSYKHLQRAKEQDTFKPGGALALLYTVTKPYGSDSAEFETIFVIRDGEGHLVSASARSRSWNKMWDNGYCTETVSNLPTTPGSYTLTIIINGGTLAQLPFTIQ